MTSLTKQHLEQRLIELRHHFHEYPELANQEFETTATIKKVLTEW